MQNKIEKLMSSIRTARMSNEQLLALGWSQAQLDAGDHLPTVSGAVSNSTQLITDMKSALANAPFSATAQAAAIAAAGPITDLPGVLNSVLLNFQEALEKLNYVLNGSMITAANQGAPAGGLIASGGSDAATYNLLVGIYQILK